MSESIPPADGQAVTLKRLFSRSTSVTIDIDALPESIWAVLTDADGFKSWNSTIVDLTGKIAPGGRLRLRSTLVPERTFKLRVKEFQPPTRLSWGDAMGTRIFTLTPNSASGTRFTMSETIGGPIFPLYARMIPPFDESFHHFARDLKAAAEENV